MQPKRGGYNGLVSAGRMDQRDDAVRLPSFSIAEMMAIVALVATDCLAIGTTQGSLYDAVSFGRGGLPMQSAW